MSTNAAPEVLELPVQTRAADVRPGTFDRDKRTVIVVASTGAMVRRTDWWSGDEYDEQLVMDERRGLDLQRFRTIGAVLDNHNAYGSSLNAIGVVERAWVEDGQLLAELRFDTDEKADAIFGKIERGIIRAVSIGYDAEYERVKSKDRDDGGEVDLFRTKRIEPFEVSPVMMPADAGAVIRSAPGEKPPWPTRRYAVRSREEKSMSTSAAPADPAPQAPGLTEADVEKRAMARVEEMLDRIKQMRSIAVDVGVDPDAAERLVREVSDFTLAKLKLHEMALQRQKDEAKAGEIARPQPPAPGREVEVTRDAADKTFAAISQALEFRAFGCADPFKVETYAANAKRRGLDPKIPQAPTDETVRRFARGRLLDIADTFLQSRGIRTGHMSIGQIAETALAYRSSGTMMTTADFPGLLANTANKLLSVGYSEVTSPWREIGLARRQDRPDFKTFTMYRRSGAPGLAKINEHGEIKRSGWGDGTSLTGQLATAGVEVAFTRQMLINDDLGAFAQQNLGLGESAVRWEDDAVITDLLYGNAVLSDTVTFFDASRGNLSADVGAPDLASIVVAGRMFAAMNETIKAPANNNGTTTRKIGHRLVGFLAALTEKLTIDQILEPRFPDAASNKLPQQLQGLRTWQEDRLQVESAAPDVHFAISNRPALVYGGLEGDPSPRLSMQVATGTDGVVWQLVHDWYVAVEDPKAVIRIPKS